MVSAVTTMDAAITAGTAERAAAFGLLDAARDALIVPTGTWNELPEQWVVRTLGDVADVRTGIAKVRITEKETRPYPFLRAANVQNGFLDLAEIKDIDVTADEAVRFALRSGDVLMVEGSGSPDRLGRGWVWDGEVECCIRPKSRVPRATGYVIGLVALPAHLLRRYTSTGVLPYGSQDDVPASRPSTARRLAPYRFLVHPLSNSSGLQTCWIPSARLLSPCIVSRNSYYRYAQRWLNPCCQALGLSRRPYFNW